MRQVRMTHEEYIKAVAALGVGLLECSDKAKQANAAKLTYGAGQAGLRGVTYFNRWLDSDSQAQSFVEICAQGEENPVQLAGTTLHELGHVIAGLTAGHGKAWKSDCRLLGLRCIKAAGTHYSMAMFEPSIRFAIVDLISRLEVAKPSNGAQGYPHKAPRPCSMGIGVRGGVSRGVGSGSRLRKYTCGCCGQIIRASTDTLEAVHSSDGGLFQLA